MFNRKKVNRNQVLSKHQDFYFNYLNIKKHLHQKNNIHPAYEYVESNIFFNALNDGFLKEIKEVKNLKPVKSFSFLDILFC